jgi:hypothetical protein
VEAELHGPGGRLWRGVRALEVDCGRPGAELLAAVRDPAIDEALVAWLSPRMQRGPNGQLWLYLSAYGRESFLGSYLAVGFRVRVYHEGVLVAEAEHSMGPPLVRRCGNELDCDVIAFGERCEGAKDDSAWELELIGDRALAMLDYDMYGWGDSIDRPGPAPWTEPTRYWAGRVRVPLAVDRYESP